MTLIIDDFIPEDYQQELINQTIMNNQFPWWFLYDMSGAQKPIQIDGIHSAVHQHGFQHTLFDHRGNYGSPYEELFIPLLNKISNYIEKNVIPVRIKIGMVMPVEGGGVAHPHVDYTSPHKTLVYYVNDTDGDTIFYKEKYDGHHLDKFSVDQKISPKRGRAIIFDGLQYHSTSYPTKDLRAFININFKTTD